MVNSRLEGGEKEMGFDNLYDMTFVANRYGISKVTLQRWVSNREIPFRKIGKNIRFSEKDLIRWERENSFYSERCQTTSKGS